MHPNRAFRWEDAAAMRAFAAETAFAHIFVAAAEGPRVAHAPVIVTEAGDLRFHLARTNRIVPHLENGVALASIAGRDFHVSPDWYASADQVPTWNYLAVEVEGRVRRLEEAELIALLDALSAFHEARLAPKPAWTRAKIAEGRFEAMLPAIVGYEIAGGAWRGTAKLGQNKSAADRAGVAAGLSALGRPAEAALVEGTLR